MHIPWWRKILPTILATLTQKERYFPEITWSSQSWIHNIFRVYEVVFWRRYGIKSESSSGFSTDKNGRRIEVHQCHSFEAMCVYSELAIRKSVKSFFEREFVPFRIIIPQLVTPGFRMPSSSPYLFAIAFDSAEGRTTGVNVSSISLSHTVTGSNAILFAHVRESTIVDQDNGVTYNLVAMSLSIKNKNTAGDNTYAYDYHLVNPTTGAAKNITANFLAVESPALSGSSYSGAAQSGQPDATGVLSENAASGGNHVITVNVVATNSWLLVSNYSQDLNPDSAVNGTLRTTAGNFFDDFTDSNGTVGTGNQTIGYHWTGADHHNLVGLSFKPVAAATVTPVITLPLMNVG